MTQFTEPVRNIMATAEYGYVFPNSVVSKTASTRAFSTPPRIKLNDGQDSLVAVGLLSGFTGKGLAPGDLLIIDDPYASPDDARSEAINERVWRFWTETADVRVDPLANVVCMFHRYHEDDLAGRLLATGKWEYIRFPAIADENEDGSDPTGRQVGELLSPRRPMEWLEARMEEDPLTFAGQFQGVPRPASAAFFKREWFTIVPSNEVPPIRQWVRFWDLAASVDKRGDQTAGALVGIADDHTIYVKDICAFRMEWPDAAQMIVETAEREAPDGIIVGVESAGMQKALVQDLFKRQVFVDRPILWPMKPRGDKKERASGWARRASMGGLRIVLGPWNQKFIEQCIAFPDGKHDDQVDAVSGAFDLIYKTRGNRIEKEPPPRRSLAYYRELKRLSASR